MQNVKDMKEVEPGIFIPTQQSFLTNSEEWLNVNMNYSCLVNKSTHEILLAFNREVDGIAYAEKHITVPTFCYGAKRDLSQYVLGGLHV